MLSQIHYRVQYVCKIKPFLSTFKYIISSYLPCEDIQGYLQFRLYKTSVIKNAESYYKKIMMKSDSYFLNPLYLNAFYAGLSLIKIRPIDVTYLFTIMQSQKQMMFTIPPIKVSMCNQCNQYRKIKNIKNSDNFCCSFCFQKIINI